MKKLLIFIMILSMLALVACSTPGNTDPDWEWNPSTPSGSPSGSSPSGSSPSGSLPSGSLPSGSAPSGSSPSVYNEEMFMIKATIKEGSDGKYNEQDVTKSYVRPVSDSALLPSNASSYPYISNAIDKSIYEIAPAYEFKSKTTAELDSFLGQIAFNSNAIAEKTMNFIRYIYVQSEGKLLLSVTFDTSAVYQTGNKEDTLITGGYVLRAYIKVEKCTLTGYENLNSFLYADLYDGDTLVGDMTSYFNKYINPFVITPITKDNSLKEGDGVWADIFVGVPLADNNSLPVKGPDGKIKYVTIWEYITTINDWSKY